MRGTCPECLRDDILINGDGTLRMHPHPEIGGNCPGAHGPGVHEVAVRLTPAEHAALTEAAHRTHQAAPAFLREAFLAYIAEGAVPPLAAQIRAWLREHGWVPGPPGPGGAIWRKDVTKDAVKDGVAVAHDEGDRRFDWGAVERIAQHELQPVRVLAMEMLAISEADSD